MPAANSRQPLEYYSWCSYFCNMRMIKALPLPFVIAEATATSSRYHHICSKRIHERDMALFQYTLAGEVIVAAAGREYRLPAGSGFLIPICNSRFSYYYPPDQRTPYKFIYLSFYDYNHIVDSINQDVGFIFKLAKNSAIISRLLNFQSLRNRDIELSLHEGTELITNLLAQLIQSRLEPEDNRQCRKLIERAYWIIEEHIEQPFNASLLAAALEISQEYLTRIFRQELGSTPYRVITAKKLQRACILLKTGNMTGKQIAESLGYEPGSHFIRLFKRELGMTPAQFRLRGSLSNV